ncbi:MAG: B12-binding domain-containing radical SAM protein [Chloroflexi bacterium]|uniref:Radical SAM protein n=1 Tax=Candidatus Chlorohelix allophototropha TaxID=3003348 RepID=A0A8T7M8G5_9CHLR|nr:B12-binding domain-containing radical SAM protein [Chloroflexota bacterium]WJW68227.1 radical SAM protein [Chloroflexota bacterium L227-S17]
MKVLLVQLPVPNNRLNNLPLALGYLKASAESAALPSVQVQILRREAQNLGGDAYLLDAILSEVPDLVGFSLYSWNSSRVLELARRIKEVSPETMLLVGGPEVNHDNPFILTEPSLDFLIFGEGETAFSLLLRHFTEHLPLSQVNGLGYRHNSILHINPASLATADVNLIPSAYLSGALSNHLDNFMFIELSRWCPSKCTFCYYGRQDIPIGGKRYFDIERIRKELEYGMARGVNSVHFVEANFNTLPHLSQIYQTIQETGANRHIRFYAEMRGEAIDEADADLLASCNFGVVEVGLQSAIPEVLAKVRRKNHLPRLVAGVQHLRQRGIEVFLDAILGLPGDTIDSFHRTIDFIEANSLAPYDLFHLQILGGTQLKTEVAEGLHGIEFQAAPPYFVLKTAELSFAQLCELRRETLLRKGDDPDDIQGLPPPNLFALCRVESEFAINPANRPPIEHLELDLSQPMPEISRLLANEVTIRLFSGDIAKATQALAQLSAPNPTTIWHIFFESAQPLADAELLDLKRAIHHKSGYLDRLAVFALGQPNPEMFSSHPSVQCYNLVRWKADLVPLADKTTIWMIEWREDKTVSEWRESLHNTLETNAQGVFIATDSGVSYEKVRRALAEQETDGKVIWWSDPGIASAFAGEETIAAFPTCYRQGQLRQVDKATLERACLRWELSKRRDAR